MRYHGLSWDSLRSLTQIWRIWGTQKNFFEINIFQSIKKYSFDLDAKICFFLLQKLSLHVKFESCFSKINWMILFFSFLTWWQILISQTFEILILLKFLYFWQHGVRNDSFLDFLGGGPLRPPNGSHRIRYPMGCRV